MESNQIDHLFDNQIGMDFQAALDLIKFFFNKELPFFKLVDEYKESTGYWGIKYSYSDNAIFIGCERGYLYTRPIISNNECSLLQFDERMQNVEVASEKNIRFTLDVIKNLLKNNIGSADPDSTPT